MKIAIIGFSGSGKSTLARKLAKFYSIDVLHLDSVHFNKNWQERTDEEMTSIVSDFLRAHDSWVIEGNYLRICKERFTEADVVIDLVFNRFICLKNVIKRYHQFKKETRPDMAEGCPEKIDMAFLYWVFHKGRTLKKKKKHQQIILNAKVGYTFKNRRKLNEYLKNLGVENYADCM